MSQINSGIPGSGPGSGTVTSITFNGGLTSTPDPVTTTGTATIDQTNLTVLDGTVYWDTGTKLLHTTATGTAGQILTSQGVGLPPIYAAAPVSGIATINGDTGSITGATVSIKDNATSGSSVVFSGSGTAMTFNVTDASDNTIIGLNAGNGAITGINNTGFGFNVLHALAGGNRNTCIGFNSGEAITSASFNTFVGNNTGNLITTGNGNVLIGQAAGFNIVNTSNNNIGIGVNTLQSATQAAFLGNIAIGTDALANTNGTDIGSYNIAIAYSVGNTYTGGETSNILLNSNGVAAEQNTLHIGAATGTGQQQLKAAYICGIDGVNVGSVAKVVTLASDQLGTATITAGANITITPGANTITIAANSGSETVAYTGVAHAASPYTVLTTDYYISADVTAGVITIKLPNAPSTGRTFVIKDKVGLAGTSNITVTTVGGAVNIDGATSFVMNTAYESIQVIFNGSTYEVF